MNVFKVNDKVSFWPQSDCFAAKNGAKATVTAPLDALGFISVRWHRRDKRRHNQMDGHYSPFNFKLRRKK